MVGTVLAASSRMREDGVYQTFVLCAYRWSGSRRSVTDLVEYLLNTCRLKGTLAWERADGVSRTRALRSPSLGPAERDIVDASDIRQLTLSVSSRRHLTALFLVFEAERFVPIPPYARYIDPDAPAERRDREGVKILSFSIVSDLYRRRFDDGRERALVERVEQAFVELGAVYGFGAETESVVPGAYSLRPGAPSAQGGRYVDFDYRAAIDGVHRYNLLSAKHRSVAREAISHLVAKGAVQARELATSGDAPRGIHLEVARWNERRAAELVAKLGVLAPQGTERSSHFLLMSAEQVAFAGGVDCVRSFRMVDELRTLRGGICEIREREVCTAEDARERFVDLQRIFGPLYSKHGQAGRHVHDLVAYPDLIDTTRVYQRIPRIEAESHGYARLFVEDRETPESSEIHLLITSEAETGALGLLRNTFAVWCATILEDPSTWGELGLGETIVNQVSEGWSHVLSKVDISRLRQEGIHLLMLMLDELNVKLCSVQYVVLGRLAKGLAGR